MSITIGRFGRDTPVAQVLTWDRDGDQVSLTGTIEVSATTPSEVQRDQLEAYVSSQDELVVPVTWDEDPTANGFYVVTAAKVTVDPDAFASGWYPFSCDMRRTSAFSGPLVESRILGALRAGGGPPAQAWHGLQNAASSYTAAGTLTAYHRYCASGQTRLLMDSTSGLLNTRASWHCPPDQWYQGASTISVGPVAPTQQVVFDATGSLQTWTVPAGVTTITINAFGAQGGGVNRGAYPNPALGGRAQCDATVTPGDVLNVVVGTQPTNATGGYGGGGNAGTTFGAGGGGASYVYNTTASALLCVAGGGGGQAGPQNTLGGYGGGLNGGAAWGDGTNAQGGTQSNGGAGGSSSGNTSGNAGTGPSGTSAGQGGNGAYHSGLSYGGSGGGGGYYGGGGGSGLNGSGGGGGSSYTPGPNALTVQGAQTGSGVVIITMQSAQPVIAYSTLVGRQPLGYVFGWQLSNELVTVTPVYTPTYLGLAFSYWSGSAWSPPKIFQITDSAGTPATLSVTSMSVPRNAPEDSRVRLTCEYTGDVQTATVDVRLRRGTPIVEIHVASTVAKTWGIMTQVAEASTAATGGIYASSTDANGNRFVLTTDQSYSTSGSSLTVSTATTACGFGVANQSPVASATTDAPQTLINQYFAAMSEQVTAVGR